MTSRNGQGRLAGSTILLTGGSGFVGKTVLATLLAHGGDFERLIVLLRAPDAQSAQRRLVEGVLRSEAFADLSAGAIRKQIEAGRLCAVAGDLESDELGSRLRGSLGGVDTVIHCAASVSFEEPLDVALALNAFGPSRLLDSLHAEGVHPHFVHVSTAFAADCHQEVVREDASPHSTVADLDPAAILESAREWRAEVERESELEAQRERFRHAAERDAIHREGMDADERAEQLRQRWVRERLAGRSRRYAIAAGWPDTYALSKAVGERLLLERSERTTVLRPSIIESALRTPHPGWLEGIKVADPLILAYASRGLTHLPGRATNRIDIVPVDYVANAAVVAAANPPDERLRTLAITSTPHNALTLGELAEHVRRYFGHDPLHGRNGSTIAVGNLKFVDYEKAIRRMMLRQRMLEAGAKAAALPAFPASLEKTLRRNSSLAGRVTRMVKIYGPYTELNCVFDDSNARAFAREVPAADRDELPFSPVALDWDEYLQGIHMPKLREMAELKSPR